MMTLKNAAQQWSEDVAGLAVDALLSAKIVEREQLDLAVEIVAEEIYVRLCLNDYPPNIAESS